MKEADQVGEEVVQNAFCCKVHCLQIDEVAQESCEGPPGNLVGSRHSCDCKDLCENHNEWDLAMNTRAIQFIDSFPQVASAVQNTFSALSFEELQQCQELDPVVSKVLSFVELRKQP